MAKKNKKTYKKVEDLKDGDECLYEGKKVVIVNDGFKPKANLGEYVTIVKAGQRNRMPFVFDLFLHCSRQANYEQDRWNIRN